MLRAMLQADVGRAVQSSGALQGAKRVQVYGFGDREGRPQKFKQAERL